MPKGTYKRKKRKSKKHPIVSPVEAVAPSASTPNEAEALRASLNDIQQARVFDRLANARSLIESIETLAVTQQVVARLLHDDLRDKQGLTILPN
jgi:hypothetical protein